MTDRPIVLMAPNGTTETLIHLPDTNLPRVWPVKWQPACTPTQLCDHCWDMAAGVVFRYCDLFANYAWCKTCVALQLEQAA